jgi:hypothetical protein
LTTPRSIRPVATVPRPLMENTSSTDIRKGLSVSRYGLGDVGVEGVEEVRAMALLRLRAAWLRGRRWRNHGRSGRCRRGSWYLLRRSRTSISTRSSRSGVGRGRPC